MAQLGSSHCDPFHKCSKKVARWRLCHFDLDWKRLKRPQKSAASLLGERLAARDPVWDGEGWGCDRVAFPLVS